MNYEGADKTLVCIDCKEEFTFTAGEQKFFTERGLMSPRRCPTCRRKRKAQKANEQFNNF
ncbi:MAG: zinc-ribbon domain-containing protein [Patescibacteria group bacterium]|nr:zinc-ribbon domain-containing protein [Patescibacteria group bacterium]